MNLLRFRHRLAPALALLALSATAFAQELVAIPQEQPITVPVGEIFEIIGAGLPADAWSWTLTKDGTFLEASRERIFHLRLLETGRYSLEAIVSNPEHGTQIRRNVSLDAQQIPAEPPAATDMLVVADPAFTTEGIVLPEGRQLLKLTPTGNANGRIHVDLDSLHDADGDGNAANDDETQGALFATDGTPIFVWFPRVTRGQSLILTAETTNGSPAQAIVPITGKDVLEEENDTDNLPPLTPNDIHVNVNGNGDVTFAMPVTADRQDVILYRWDFGDGHDSLRDVPTHRYFQEGTYTVKAQAVDMRTGNVVTSAEREITITASDMLPPSSSGSSEGQNLSEQSSSVRGNSSSSAMGTASSASQASTSSAASTGGIVKTTILWTVLKLMGVAILALVVGIGLSWLLGKIIKMFRTRSENVQDSGATRAGRPDLLSPAPAVTLRKNTATEQSPPQVTEAAPAEAIDESKAPSWLKKGLETSIVDTPAPISEPAPMPAPIESVAEVPAPAPSGEALPSTTPVQEPTPAPVDTAALPPWLAQSTDATTPAPVEPAPATTATQDSLPPWLSSGMDAPLSPADAQASSKPVTEPPAVLPPAAVLEPTTAPEPMSAPVPMTEPEPATSAQDPLPPWLQQASEPIPPSTEPAAGPAVVGTQETPSNQETLPSWLQQDTGSTAEAAPAVEPEPAVEKNAPVPTAAETVTVPDKPLQAAATVAQETTAPATQTTATAADDVAKAERERERRRRKRQRYRENLKKRQGAEKTSVDASASPMPKKTVAPPAPTPSTSTAEAAPKPETKPIPAADDDVAFVIRADSITPPHVDPPVEPKDDDDGDVGHP